MRFLNSKLPKAAMKSMVRVPSKVLKPFTIVHAPIYLWFEQNEKFVSIKEPLDFFTPEDLKKLKSFEYVYFPEITRMTFPFRTAAKRVRYLIAGEGPEFPAPFEISNEVLISLGPLWWEYPEGQTGIEPFLVDVFVGELLGPFPQEKLGLREASVDAYDLAMLRSSWTVFAALLLGCCDSEFLNRLRLLAFDWNGDPSILRRESNPYGLDLQELLHLSSQMIDVGTQLVTRDMFEAREERISQKLAHRLKRISVELSRSGNPPTVFGERGFLAE